MSKLNIREMSEVIKNIPPDAREMFLDLIDIADNFADKNKELEAKCKHLESEVARLERLAQ